LAGSLLASHLEHEPLHFQLLLTQGLKEDGLEGGLKGGREGGVEGGREGGVEGGLGGQGQAKARKEGGREGGGSQASTESGECLVREGDAEVS
jgi:hypothetical protein